VQSTRLADPFEPLNSSLSTIGEGARALVRQPETAVFFAKIEKPPRRQGVKNIQFFLFFQNNFEFY